MSRNRALTAAIVAFAVTGSVGTAFYIHQTTHKTRKRRAGKSSSGARTDVVVVAGAVANPLASAVYLDLERRGFVVYVIANTPEDETYIRSQSRIDLLPLHLDLTDPFQASQQLGRFENLLNREHRVFEDAEAHRLRLRGLVLIPDTSSGPVPALPSYSSSSASAAATASEQRNITQIPPEEWSDALNAKVLTPIATTQLLLPTLLSHPGSRILLLTPSVTPSLRPAGHGIENTVYGALENFITTLTAEVKGKGTTSVSHFKLGNFDIPAVTAKLRRDGVVGNSSSLLGKGRSSRLVATPVRKLHEAVFDALIAERSPPRTWHLGRGSLSYDLIGRWVPAGVVGMMMGWVGRTGAMKETEGDGAGTEDLQGSAGSLTWEKIDEEV